MNLKKCFFIIPLVFIAANLVIVRHNNSNNKEVDMPYFWVEPIMDSLSLYDLKKLHLQVIISIKNM